MDSKLRQWPLLMSLTEQRAREEVLGCEESPENTLIKCSTKGSTWVATLMLYLVLGGIRGGLSTETMRPCCRPLLRAAGSGAPHLAVRHCWVPPVSERSFQSIVHMLQRAKHKSRNKKPETKSNKLSKGKRQSTVFTMCIVTFALENLEPEFITALGNTHTSFSELLSQVYVPRERALQLESGDLYSRCTSANNQLGFRQAFSSCCVQ